MRIHMNSNYIQMKICITYCRTSQFNETVVERAIFAEDKTSIEQRRKHLRKLLNLCLFTSWLCVPFHPPRPPASRQCEGPRTQRGGAVMGMGWV